MLKANKIGQKRLEILIFVVIILVISLFWYFYFSKNNNKKTDNQNNKAIGTQQIFPTSIPPTPEPLPHGKKGFVVSLGTGNLGPKMGQGYIDPMDPQTGEKQTLTIEVNDKYPIKKVVASLITDNKTSPEYELKQINGTPNKGNWQGSWIIDDGYLHKYIINLKAFGNKDVTSISITLRQ